MDEPRVRGLQEKSTTTGRRKGTGTPLVLLAGSTVQVSDLAGWFWPVLSFSLLILWLWTWLQGRRKDNHPATPTPHLDRIDAEDTLKAAYAQTRQDSEEHVEDKLSVPDLAEATRLSETQAEQGLEALIELGWVEKESDGALRLTERGESRARELTRAHRLWEQYLVEREGMPMEAVHEEAHRREHTTTPEDLEDLDAELGYPAWDPHGHAIPGPEGQLPSSRAGALSEMGEPGDRLRIVSLSDASPPLLAQLLALGLRPSLDVEVVERSSDLVRVLVDDIIIPLARAAAEQVSVVASPVLPRKLGELPVGTRAQVVEITGSGKHQRRMLDLGFVPGAEVAVVRQASLGDPIEYRVKDTGVAMRRSDAASILVEEVERE